VCDYPYFTLRIACLFGAQSRGKGSDKGAEGFDRLPSSAEGKSLSDHYPYEAAANSSENRLLFAAVFQFEMRDFQ
jgi:hypothetical protein